MGNFLGLDEQTLGDIRLNGIGWIGAMLVVGATILAARFLISWQVRKLARNLTQSAKGPNENGDAIRGRFKDKDS
ncbi:MAG: hypothetical protein L0Y57_05530 [Beijerinckiaceae bacterium]|nr:hypothetical protein [Beijerinckiaceae bacterium]